MKESFALGVLVALAVLSVNVAPGVSEELVITQTYGQALGAITLKVVDDKNSAVSGASVEAHFENVPEKVVRKGNTDAKGIYYCEGSSIGDVWFGVEKDGYYKTSQIYSFARNAPRSNDSTRRNRWTPWNPTFTVTLKRIRKPTPMYAKHVEFMRIPLDQSVGFDFEAGDCVAPYGKGVVSDVVFRVGKPKEKNSYRFPLGYSFSNPMDGIQLRERDAWSNFSTLYDAPESGYEAHFEQVDQLFRSPNRLDTKQWYYILRVRNVIGTDGRLLSARYAKMWAPVNVGCKGNECSLTFLYWYNPDGTRNLEYDTKRNLLKNLRSGDAPPYP